MALVIKGGTSGVNADVGTLYKALKVEQVPSEVGAFGEYCVTNVTGSMVASMAAEHFYAFRWTDASRMALIKRIRVQARNTTGYTQGSCFIEAVIARSFSAVHSANNTNVTPTGDTGKLKVGFATTLVSSIQIATTDGMTGQTATLDSYPFTTLELDTGTVVKPMLNWADLWSPVGNEWPVVLTANEGIILRATTPATGVSIFSVKMKWAEVANF